MDILVDTRSYMRSIEEYEHSKNGEVAPTANWGGGKGGRDTTSPLYCSTSTIVYYSSTIMYPYCQLQMDLFYSSGKIAIRTKCV